MKKQILFVVLVTALVVSCSNNNGERVPRAVDKNSGEKHNFSKITEQEWKLTEVHINGNKTQFNRSDLSEFFTDSFTVNFDGQTISGTGAPNLFSAPYTLGKNQTISIMPMRSTLMASLFEPEHLSEHEFFTYLQGANVWKTVNNNLELFSKAENRREIRLVFSK
jgi:heat shock protein HslJ